MLLNEGNLQSLTGGLRLKVRIQHPEVHERTDRGCSYWYFRYWDDVIAPHMPDVIFADEAQDLNPMQLSLVRRWGENAQYFIVAADDDQTIYSWCGATPDAVLDPEIPEDHKIILKQSHRVPRRVHALANRLIHQVSRRQEKVYEPRPEDGMCLNLSQGGYKSAEYWILKTIMQHLKRGEKVMLLACCSYIQLNGSNERELAQV